MIGAISPISTLFGGAFGIRPTSAASSSANSSQSSSSTGGVTTPQDVVAISGVRPADPVSRNDPSQTEDQNQQQSDQGGGQQSSQQSAQTGGQKQLSKDQQAAVAQLKEIDRSVHAHEQAHAAVGGGLAGAPSYHYTTGPDGHQYAVGGEVPISIPSVSAKNPQATIQQLRQVIAAATAPADPSGQDRAVAAQAQAELGQAEAEAAKASAASATGDAQGSGDDGQAKTAKSGKAPASSTTTGAPATTGAPPSSGSGTAAAGGTTTADDADKPAPIPIVGPPAFGSKKPDQPLPGQAPPATGNTGSGNSGAGTTTGGSSSTPGRASPIFAYQQAQSGFGQTHPRGSNAISLSV